MYHVIINLDETRNRSYYHSYVAADGNIKCDELPPYADIRKAHACYWDSDASAWVYDADKYAAIVAEQDAAAAAAEQAKKEAAAVPTNEELAEAVMELADGMATMEAAVVELAEMIGGGEDNGKNLL